MSDSRKVNEWAWRPLGEIADFKNGVNFSGNEKGVKGILTIDVLNMYSQSYTVSMKKLYRVNKLFRDDYKLIKGDILFVRSSLKEEGVGWATYFDGFKEDVTFCGFIIRCRIKDAEFDNCFLTFYFRSNRMRKELLAGSGKVAVTNINQSVLSNLLVPKPPKEEQDRIICILLALQRSIDIQLEFISITEALKKSLIDKLFTHGTKGEKVKNTDIGRMPESWHPTRIDAAFDFTSKPKDVNIRATAQVPFIPMEMIPDQDFYVDKYRLKKGSELTSGTYFEEGDLLLAKITPSFENGKQAIARLKSFKWGYATTEVIPIKERKGKSCINFLFYYLLKPDVRQFLEGKMEGSTGRQRLNKSTIKNLTIPFPSTVDEQNEIGLMFMKLDEKIRFHKGKLKTHQKLLNTLLNDLMTGTIRVHDIDFDDIMRSKNQQVKYQTA